MGLSRVQYIMSITDITKVRLKEINSMLYQFLWRGPDKIARHTAIGMIDKGGLNMPDIYAKYKAVRVDWIRRYCKESVKHPWKLFLDRLLNSLGGMNFLLKCNFEVDLLDKKKYGFFSIVC